MPVALKGVRDRFGRVTSGRAAFHAGLFQHACCEHHKARFCTAPVDPSRHLSNKSHSPSATPFNFQPVRAHEFFGHFNSITDLYRFRIFRVHLSPHLAILQCEIRAPH